jgi:hypothetical protein
MKPHVNTTGDGFMNAGRLSCVLLTIWSLMICGACTPKQETAANAAGASAAASPAPEPEKKSLTACEMVTAAEMSALLGGAVTAQNGPTNGQTACTYNPVAGISPYAELKVEWGSGEAAMMGASFANAHEPGLAEQSDGLGDQAVSVGPATMIRRGDDLVTVTLSGVDDIDARIRSIYALVDKRM